ncbi:single-stranded DNA-binding protein [Sinomonas atrocyanea]|uniref:single-stranded DNA-binding protein n=1 Tax=Sinomonas atrocyanea TaxID=37927 RepID=UPI003D97927B
MSNTVTLRGWVGTDPTKGFTKANTFYTRFRLSVSEGHFDRERGAWVDTHTSWYTVVCFGAFAQNVAESVRKGQRVIVMGKIRVATWQRTDGTYSKDVDLMASSVGHDLALGIAVWNRRRDEPAGRPSSIPLAHVEGIGPVDPATGELPEVPFDPDEPPFGEVPDYPELEAGDVPALEDRPSDELGPEQRLLSA